MSVVGTYVQDSAGRLRVSVLINGVPQPLYCKPWELNLPEKPFYVAGRPGRYSLLATSLLPDPAEVLCAVDGQSVKDDVLAGPNDEGRLFAPFETFEYIGWRVDGSHTRDFLFGNLGDSVTAQSTGTVNNAGVIGFIVYANRQSSIRSSYPHTPHGAGSWAEGAYKDVGMASVLPQMFEPPMRDIPMGDKATRMPRNADLATGIGDMQYNLEYTQPVTPGRFTRGTSTKIVIGYASEEILRERHIIEDPEPDPFPGLPTGYQAYRQTPGA